MGFYIRLRGKVSGPFSDEQLRGMARQGRLTPFHEVSPDGVNWGSARDAGFAASAAPPPIPAPPSFATFPPVPLSTGPGLPHGVARDAPPVSRTMLGTPVGFPEPISDPVASPPSPTGLAGEGGGPWFYEADGRQNGPIDESALIELIARGRIRPGDLVWEQGLPDWLPLEQTRLAGRVPKAGLGVGPNTSVPFGYVLCGLALGCPPLGLLGLVFGALNCRDRERQQHGIAQLCLSVACAAAGSFLWLLLWHWIQNPEG